jgi:hypothetical protein
VCTQNSFTHATIGWLNCRELMAWDSKVASDAIALYAQLVAEQLAAHSGYLVEMVDGFVLAAFVSPLSALTWALTMERSMKRAPWPQRLLHHALAEEIVIAAPAAAAHHTAALNRGGKSSGSSKTLQQAGAPPRPSIDAAHGSNQMVLFRGPRIKVRDRRDGECEGWQPGPLWLRAHAGHAGHAGRCTVEAAPDHDAPG